MRGRPILILGLAMAFGTVEAEEEPQGDSFAVTNDRRAGYDWWSLQAVKAPAVPAVKSVGSARNEIDRFVLSRLEAAGLQINPPADRATYIRRLSYDLTGLLPTPEEVQTFVEDRSPDAYETLVDRLLESPHYGERWGRHWLDVVRFAESNGFERDGIRRNFWPYRDYVIRSFNEDKPYDQFVIEQLAGDALAEDDPAHRVATGFLAAGPKNDVSTVSEIERLLTRQDELDEFVSATGTTFLGMTIGCARCHHHKFDPIPTEDYYALTAVFAGCNHDAGVIMASPEERRRHAELLAGYQKPVAAKKGERADILDAARQRLAAHRAEEARRNGKKSHDLPAPNHRRNEDTFAAVMAKFVRFTVTGIAVTGTSSREPCLDELEVYGAEKANLALSSAGAKASASSLLPGHPIHQIDHLNDGKHGNKHSWISDEEGGGWAQIELAAAAEINRVVWGRDRTGKAKDRLAISYRIEVSLDGKSWKAVSDSSRRPQQAIVIAEKEVIDSLPAPQREAFDKLVADIKTLDEKIKGLKSPPTTYAIRDGGGQASVPVLKRGDVRSRGEAVPAATISAVKNLPSELSASSGPERRLKLARWITHPENPLASRVLVNRVWHYHFGRGIVDTPSDFGFKGGKPSHPALLDWLAADFVKHGWKIKRLHRQIVLSATYRQSGDHREEAARQDAGNRLLWRYAPRRLEGEAMRDIILQVSGKLDRTPGGPSFELFTYRDGNVPDYVLLEKPGPQTWRRSVYRYNIRTFSSPLMSAFDCPDPSISTPSRSRSTTPLQSLSLLNNHFVVEQAGFLAERVRNGAGDDPLAQVDAAYRLVLLRGPAGAERDRAGAFVRDHGLAAFCRVLLNSNEFLYVF